MAGDNLRYCILSLNKVFFPNKNRTTHTDDIPCEIIVANAAPLTPILNPNINTGSRMILQTAPITTVIILILANP